MRRQFALPQAVAVLALVTAVATGGAAHAADPTVTQCDTLAAHPSDPDRISPGVSSAATNHAVAIAACEHAVKIDSTSARLNYQLARVYFYDGQTEKALPHLEYAADAGYRQAQFVLGYILFGGLQGVAKDVCKTEDLWAKSARSGRLAALVSYPHHVLRGRFSACRIQVGDTELASFLTQARQRNLDYYQTVLVGDLAEDLQRRMASDQDAP